MRDWHGQRCWCGFRAPARCRSETGAPCDLRGWRCVGAALSCRRCGFRAPARCRSDRRDANRNSAPHARRRARCGVWRGAIAGGFRAPARCRSGALHVLVILRGWRCVGSQPGLAPAACRRGRATARCRSETGAPCPRDSARVAMRGFVAVRLAGRGVVGAGFALPRDAGRRPALQAVPALHTWWRTAERAKNKWQRTPFAARDFGGKCERGLPPFTRR